MMPALSWSARPPIAAVDIGLESPVDAFAGIIDGGFFSCPLPSPPERFRRGDAGRGHDHWHAPIHAPRHGRGGPRKKEPGSKASDSMDGAEAPGN